MMAKLGFRHTRGGLRLQHLPAGEGIRSILFWTVPFIFNIVLALSALLAVGSNSAFALNVGTYDQCSNDQGTGYTTGDTGCRWINGNLQRNNSIYFEGDATVQRFWLTELVPGSIHTITLKYGTTKGGKHAYDFLTTWDWSEDWIMVADRCQGITGCETASTESYLDIPQDPNVPDSFEPSNMGERVFTMRGGTLTLATTPAIISGDYSGDSETVITVYFTVGPDTGSMCSTKQGVTTCAVALWFGAHVAAQANWGLGLGAGSISGSPYHVALDAIDSAAVGQRDNQMQADVVTFIPNGTIVIVKDAVPNDAQDFSFNLNNNSTIFENFSLDDDSDSTLPNSRTFSVPPGTWTATELSIPTGWTLTNLVCVDPTNNTTVDLTGGKATINLVSNETVTCTFTNSRDQGYLNLSKVFNPLNSGFNGTFAIIYNCGSGDQTVNLAAGASTTVGPFNTGTSCTVSEPTLPTAPTGWTFGTPLISSSPATIVKGDTTNPVVVTVTNTITRDQGYLKLSKVFNPLNSGFTGTFAIVYNCGAGNVTVNLGASESTTVGPFDTGTICTVNEPTLPTAPAGWIFGPPSIFGSPATIVKGDQATAVAVTVTNSIDQQAPPVGTLILAKSLTGGPNGYTGPFTIHYRCVDSNNGTVYKDADASVDAGSWVQINNITIGTTGISPGTSCTVSETPPSPPSGGYKFGTPSFSPSATVKITTTTSSVTVTTNNILSNCPAICDVVGTRGTVDKNDIAWIIGHLGQRVLQQGSPHSGDCVADGVLSGNDSTACQKYLGSYTP